ncbi:hypothetical protein V6N11_059314 [Hibiscus sabdariffa]|uniref:Uncharacterized protein n=1 Tax=Hibiscus sabdariffa TaxID=183260 RepID=A0ABR2U718_9ROSI
MRRSVLSTRRLTGKGRFDPQRTGESRPVDPTAHQAASTAHALLSPPMSALQFNSTHKALLSGRPKDVRRRKWALMADTRHVIKV